MSIYKNEEDIKTIKSPEQDKGKNNIPIYFKNKYLFKIFAILSHKGELKEGGEYSYLELGNLATESINNQIEGLSNNISIVKGFPNFIYESLESGEPNVYENYLSSLKILCEGAKSSGKTLILGFSSMGGYELLPKLSKIIKQLKSEYENLIFIIGGADFNALPDQKFLDMVFDYGIDIVNIGGATEFTKFFGNISENDNFYRDENGFLRIETKKEIPKNIIFENQKDDLGKIIPGKKIETTFYYNEKERELHFTINNNPCLNQCSYCANFIHQGDTLRDNDLDKAIIDINRYIGGIEEKKIILTIDNPNPLQYTDKFEKFLQNIDLSKVKQLGFFGDFMGMGNKKVYDKIIIIIDNLLKKWPNLNITIHLAIDALHEVNDGDFVGRTIGKKVAVEKQYIAAFEQFDDFQIKYGKNPRIFIPLNIIVHPNIEVIDYKNRFDFISKYSNEGVPIGIFPLVPLPNTKIEKDHKGYFIPEYETINEDDNHKNTLVNKNYWSYFYLNSGILDAYILSKQVGLYHIFEVIINKICNDSSVDFESEKKEKFREEIFFSFLKGNCQKLERDIKEVNKFSIFGKLNSKKNERAEIKKILLEIVDFTVYYIDFIIKRENYIAGINQDYKNNPKLDKLISDLIEYKNKFMKIKEII